MEHEKFNNRWSRWVRERSNQEKWKHRLLFNLFSFKGVFPYSQRIMAFSKRFLNKEFSSCNELIMVWLNIFLNSYLTFLLFFFFIQIPQYLKRTKQQKRILHNYIVNYKIIHHYLINRNIFFHNKLYPLYQISTNVMENFRIKCNTIAKNT